jgi:hypothetical protein
MIGHLASCSKITRSIGRLAESLDDCSESHSISPSVVDTLEAKSFPSFSREERTTLDLAFARAVHKTGTEFSLFDHPAYRLFLSC